MSLAGRGTNGIGIRDHSSFWVPKRIRWAQFLLARKRRRIWQGLSLEMAFVAFLLYRRLLFLCGRSEHLHGTPAFLSLRYCNGPFDLSVGAKALQQARSTYRIHPITVLGSLH